MAGFRERTQSFLSGFMLGLLVAGAFFILKLDDYFKELNFYKRLSLSGKQTETVKETEPVKVPPQPVNTYKYNPVRKDTAKISQKNDSVADPSKLLSETVIASNDSLNRDSTQTTYTAAEGEDIVVKKDELLMIKNVEVAQLLPLTLTDKKDSLLQQVSGIRNVPDKSFFVVEFWHSPLNYKGYKMTKNKIILYGLNTTDQLKLYHLGEEFYMKDVSLVYHLDYTNDYRPFERVHDELLLAKLK